MVDDMKFTTIINTLSSLTQSFLFTWDPNLVPRAPKLSSYPNDFLLHTASDFQILFKVCGPDTNIPSSRTPRQISIR